MSMNMFKKRIKRSKAAWLSLLLKRGNSRSKSPKHHSERGIAIPLVIGIGLLMMLLSITIVIRSQSSQINTSNLKQAATASEVAETGLARIQEIFKLNPSIAIVSLTSPSGSQWRDLAQWKDTSVRPSSSCPPTAASTVLNAMTPDANGWFDIETGKRQFRVVGYTFTATATDTGVGNLKLEGRFINESASQVLSTSALQVTIPVNPGDINNIPIPGVWPDGTWDATKGNGVIAGDVIIPCSTAATLVNNPGYKKIQSNLQLPTLPAIPTSPAPINLGSITSTVTLPRASDITANTKIWESSPKVYEYQVDKIDITGNGTVTIDPNYKVTLYMTGNVDKTTEIIHNADNLNPTVTDSNKNTANETITVSESMTAGADITFSGTVPTGITAGTTYYVGSTGTTFSVYTGYTAPSTFTGKVDIGSNSTSGAVVSSSSISCNALCRTAAYKPTDFRIYGYGTTSTTTPPQICVNGNRQIDAFILAPSYAVGRTGSSSYYGSVWVDGFMTAASCGSANSALVVTQTGTWSDIGLSPQNLPPQISASQTWTKMQAQ